MNPKTAFYSLREKPTWQVIQPVKQTQHIPYQIRSQALVVMHSGIATTLHQSLFLIQLQALLIMLFIVAVD